MGGSYRLCTECGKRALSIATRCPGCGRELPAPAVPESGSSVSPGMVAWGLAVAAVLAAAGLLRNGQSAEPPPTVAPPDSIALASEVAYAAVPGPESAGELHVARTWINVRKARSRRAELEALLLPGDTVLADSLDRGWYRVALEGEVLGYVHRSTLAD